MEEYIKFFIDDDGAMHKVVSMEIYFTSEEERDKFDKALQNGDYKRVIKCVDCKKWGSGTHRCGITGAFTQHDDYCSRGDRK